MAITYGQSYVKLVILRGREKSAVTIHGSGAAVIL